MMINVVFYNLQNKDNQNLVHVIINHPTVVINSPCELECISHTFCCTPYF